MVNRKSSKEGTIKLSNGPVDESQNTCYQKLEGELSALIAEPESGIDEKRLSMALNLILSEKDVADYFESKGRSSQSQKEIKEKKTTIL